MAGFPFESAFFYSREKHIVQLAVWEQSLSLAISMYILT